MSKAKAKSTKTTKSEPKPESKPEKATKKSVCIELVSRKAGASIDEMAQAMVDRKLDADVEKNKRIARAWLSKIGFKLERNPETGRYTKS